jgi:hypothetical protein
MVSLGGAISPLVNVVNEIGEQHEIGEHEIGELRLENMRLENCVVALLKCPLPYLVKNVPFFESCDGTAVVGLVGTVESALCVKGPTGNYAAVVLRGKRQSTTI